MIKKTKRQHQLWTEWKSIQDMKPIAPKLEAFLKQPMAGRWYYTYSKMCESNSRLLENNKLKKLYVFTKDLLELEKYKFNKFNIDHLNHFFK